MLPGRIPRGAIQREPAMTIDLLPTLARLVGAPLPEKKIDGLDIWPLFLCEQGARNPHEAYVFYFGDNELQAVRSGRWKLILPHRVAQVVEGHEVARGGIPGEIHQQVIKHELYDLETDRGERHNVYSLNPAVAERLSKYAEEAREELGDALSNRTGKGTRNPHPVGDR
jgi:arylsulfatase A-like enzyme